MSGIPRKELSLKALVLRVAYEVLEKQKILRYSELVTQIVLGSQRLKDEIQKRHSSAFLHFYLSRLVKQGYLIRLKAPGDKKHTYITLPKYAEKYTSLKPKETQE